MKEFFLVHPTTSYTPLGPLYLAGALEKQKINTTLLPASLNNTQLEERLTESNPVAIGMSVITSDEIPAFIEKSRLARKHNVPVIWGGVHSTLNAEQVIREDYVDYVIKGQAEQILPDYLISLPKQKRIVTGSVNDLDSFIPAWYKADLSRLVFSEEHSVHSKKRLEYDESRGKKRKNIFYYLLTSRGCPFKCSFCSENLNELNNGWNAHSADYVKEQIIYLKRKLNKEGIKMDGIGFWDDMFWRDRNRAEEIISFTSSQDIGYLVESRASFLLRNNNEMFRKLSDTDCLQVFIGAESANQQTLNYIKKGEKVENYLQLTELAQKYKLPVRFSFIVGFPGESDESVNLTLDFVDRLNEMDYVSVSGPKLFTPYPGTLEYQRAINEGMHPPFSTIDWSDIKRISANFENNYPWIKRNLHKKTIERLRKL